MTLSSVLGLRACFFLLADNSAHAFEPYPGAWLPACQVTFRTLMGCLPDKDAWRFRAFAGAPKRPPPASISTNPCVAVASPTAHAIHHGGDAAAAWGGSVGGDGSGIMNGEGAGGDGSSGSGSSSSAYRVGIVDAYSPVQASPTAATGLADGLHPTAGSDESFAVNQLLMGWLCTSGGPEAKRARAARDWSDEERALEALFAAAKIT